MIAESHSWKNELIIISNRIEKQVHTKKDWSGKKYTRFEKDVMFGFYIIRKLIESKKLTNRIISTNIKCDKYPNSGMDVTFMNNHRIPDLYDFKTKSNQKFELKILLNQFIHSYIFHPILALTDYNGLTFTDISEHNVTDEELQVTYEKSRRELVSIRFNSYDKRNDFIYEINVNTLIQLFKNIGNCEVNSTIFTYNEKKKDYDIEQSYVDNSNLDLPF